MAAHRFNDLAAPAKRAGRDVPDGHHSITPYFTVDDADRLISFLIAGLDALPKSENPVLTYR